MSERIQKHLAQLGLGSRRQIEQWIKAGRIRTDHGIAKLGDKIETSSRVYIDNRLIVPQSGKFETRIIAYHKEEGEVSTHRDPQHRQTFLKSLPEIKTGKWMSVGRLDINTSGLILFSNNGNLAHSLMHPSCQIERVYLCRVFGQVNRKILNQLQAGVISNRETVRLDRVEHHRGSGMNQWYRVTLKRGKYREIRRAWESVDCQVSRLIRIRYGPVELPRTLKPGGWIELTPEQVRELQNLAIPAEVMKNK